MISFNIQRTTNTVKGDRETKEEWLSTIATMQSLNDANGLIKNILA